MVDHTPESDDSAGQTHTARPLKMALELVAAGYYVAPVVIRRDPATGKKLGDYLGIRWHDRSTRAPEIVRDWHAQYACSFLVDTGRSGVFAVDLDVPPTGPSGADVWTGAGLGYPVMQVQTPGGGLHLYFRAPAGEPLTVHKRIHGHPIDVRGDGGHVYAPGAVVLDPHGVPELRGYEIVSRLLPARSLPELPTEAATFLHAERGAPRKAPAAQGEVRTRGAVIDILKGQLEKVMAAERREGSGFRSLLLGAAMVWGRAVAAGIVSEEAAAKRLERGVAAVWGQADRDDRRWIRHGLEDGQADPWTVVPDDYDTTVPRPVQDQEAVTVRETSSSEASGVSTPVPPLSISTLSNGGAVEADDATGGTGVAAHTGDDSDGLPAELEPEPDSWAPVDLGPYLDGDVVPLAPSVGVVRDDGARVLYPGLEHAVIGAMESGKSWFALACVAAELIAGHRCIYVHFEEASPRTSVERLRLFGVGTEVIRSAFTFVGPERRITPVDVDRLLAGGAPTLVVLDGQNEAMALHGQEIMAPEGAAEYRRRLVKPFTRAGAAVLSLDHVVKDREEAGSGVALGSVHKGNGLDGALILLENYSPFGRGRDGASGVSVTKDRPAALRQLGQQRDPRNPRKFFVGTMHVDATSGWSFRFSAPGQPDAGEDPEFAAMREERAEATRNAELDEKAYAAVVELDLKGIEVSSNKVRGVVGGKGMAVTEALHRLERAGRIKNSSVGQAARWVPGPEADQK
jgi:hypothetical protein